MTLGRPLVSPGFVGLFSVGRSGLAHGRGRRDGGSLLKKDRAVAAIHCRNGSDSSESRLGRVIGGWQWRAADRRCALRCGHSSRGASGLGVAFVGALFRRIDSWRRSAITDRQSGKKARDRSQAPDSPATTPGSPLVSRPAAQGLTGGLFVDANYLPVSLAAKLDFAGPPVETLDAYRR
jgi:hypothetical protein